VLAHARLFRGRRVLELGCGSGLVGLALQHVAARQGGAPAEVVLSDGDESSISNCRFNLALNGVSGALGAERQQQQQQQGCTPCLEVLRWEEGGGGRRPEVVLGADLMYTPEMVHLLLAVVADLLGPGRSARQEQEQEQEQAAEGAPGCSCAACAAPRQQRCAIVSTVVRGETNLRLFLASAEGYGLELQEICWPGPAAGAAAGGGGCGAGAGGGAGGLAPASGCSRIWHHAGLEVARPRMKLYRLVRLPG
jgi:hypothetical protein